VDIRNAVPFARLVDHFSRMSSSSDRSVSDLLTRARAGDAAARDALFERCRNYVAVVARSQVESWMRPRIDASDIVQQTLLEAHRGLGKFAGESEGEWLAWLRQILTHNTQDFIRRCRTEKRGGALEVSLDGGGSTNGHYVSEPSTGAATPSQVLLEHEQEIELAEAIAQLAPDHQEVIVLRNLQRLPFDEIATLMGRSRPAVQMLWTRAIRQLEGRLRKSE
jgi:RNA polymerase sigma-70 factor (ECF subfamily)